jgi:hypothetical protein
MKSFSRTLFVSLLSVFSFQLTVAQISDAERKAAIDQLNSTKQTLLKSIEGLSDAQLNFKSSPDSWSIAECVEHIAISETNIFGLLQHSLQGDATPDKKSEKKLNDEQTFAVFADRSNKVKTSEAFKPSGKFGSHAATVQEFVTKRDSTILYAQTTNDDLRNHFFKFPVDAVGTLDSYQILMMIAGHSKRHTLQIEEVKKSTGYPKK